MKPANLQPFIIFSTESPKKSATENTWGRQYVTRVLPSANEVTGYYKGTKEKSFLVSALKEHDVQDICTLWSQECYLYVFADRTAELRRPDGTQLATLDGTFKEVTEKHSKVLENFTVFSGKYWGVV